MASKRYVSRTGVKYTFLINVKGSIKSITFKGNEKDCIIKDPAVQKAVEESEFFKNGLIGVAPGTTAGGFDEDVAGLAGTEKDEEKLEIRRSGQSSNDVDKVPAEGELVRFENVTDINEAKDVLKGEPYNISGNALRTPGSIKLQAEKAGVAFPNVPELI